MKKLIYGFLIIFCLIGAIILKITPVFADDTTDETQLFSGEDTVVSQDTVVKDNVGDELKQNHIGFSGQLDTATTFIDNTSAGLVNDWTGKEPVQLLNQADADLFLDVRLKQGIKGFLSAAVNYYPLTTTQLAQLGLENNTIYTINELFVDTNWNNKVYFRTGKQVLQWGTGYFWNPTDLINIDKKSFLDMNKTIEGTYGEKIQIPIGAKKNVYFFVKMDDAETVDEASLAAKYEFLVGETEMSFSAVTGGGFKPVYGYDFSGAKLGGLNLHGEISLNLGDHQKMLNYDDLTVKNEADDWFPKACLGFTKYFTNGAIKDRISVTSEFYYNGAGYDQNIFQRVAAEPVSAVPSDPTPKQIFMPYYQPYMNSKYYMAIFSSIQKFMNPNVTLNINAIANLVDHSSTLTTGITYTPTLTDFTFDFHINGYFGDPNTEATFLGNRYSVYLGTKILF